MNELRWVTSVCCQWRGRASYDSDVHIETFILRGKLSGKIATEQQPPIRYKQAEKKRQRHKDNEIFAA